MDITGSMATYLDYAKEKVFDIIESIKKETNAIVKLGFIRYQDYYDNKDEYLFYPESELVKKFISNAKAGGGKDIEDMGGGLIAALNYKWNSNTKFIMIIADAR